MEQIPDVILLVDDNRDVLDGTARVLEQEGFPRCERAVTGEEALAAIEEPGISAVLLDLGLPDLSGEDLLIRLRREHPGIPVIIVTALSDIEAAVRCMGSGAYDYVVKGSDPGRLMSSLRRALDSRRKDREIAALRERMQAASPSRPEAFAAIVTGSERMRSLFRFIEAVAPGEEPLLLQGETGTGKELFAEAIYKASGERGPYVATNLGGMDELMVSDCLFGHQKGAYTGAAEARKGLAASASGGTLFLDEIGELSPSTQVKLLRFIENREYFPLGSDQAKRSDARIVAATNRDLESLVREGKFRRDLLYRLSTYRIDIPPLRDRRDDIPLLCGHFLAGMSIDGREPSLSQAALDFLVELPFPGNVRELRGILLKANVEARGDIIDRASLERLIYPGSERSEPASATDADRVPLFIPSRFPTIRQAVSELISEALKRTGGQQNQAALLLGISPQALSQRLKRSSDEDPS